jgi:type I restriction-modification system, S subunit, putative
LLKYITPRIRFQEFDSWWEKIKLTDLGISVGGTAIESEFDPDGKYKVISIGSYSEESKYKDQGIRAIYSKKTEKRILEKDDLTMILNDKTSTGKIIGRVLLIDEDNSYVYNQRTQRICLNKNKYVPDFIFQLLNADTNRNKIVRSAQGNTQIYVNWSDISNLDYLIPASFEEQFAIGSLFRNIDDLLASYKDNLINYQSLKATMLSKMFPKAGQTVPEIRLDGFDTEWECVKMADIFQIIDGDRGKSYPGESDFSSFGHTLFLDTGNVKKTGLDFSTTKFISEEKDKELRNGKLISGDFILTSRGTLGNVAYYDENIQKRYSSVRINSAMLILRPLLGAKIAPEYILAVLRGNLISNFMKVNQVGSAQPHITKKEFSNIKVLVPSNIQEQQAIGSYFSNLDNLINSYQEKISQLEILKKKLLQDMFI